MDTLNIAVTLNLTAVPTKLRIDHTAAVKTERRAKSKYDAVYDEYYAIGYRSKHLTKEISNNASVATGDSEKMSNPLYEDIWDIGVRALPARLQTLAYMSDADALSLPKPDRADRSAARTVGRDTVHNTIKALDRRDSIVEASKAAKERREKIIALIPKKAGDEAKDKDAEALVNNNPKEGQNYAKLFAEAKLQLEQNESVDHYNKSIPIKVASLISTLAKAEMHETERKYLDRFLTRIDPQRQEEG